MRQSMTGFASRSGETAGLRWGWELRGVNGKGLELRLRLPDWIEGLEPLVRAAAQKALTRGSVQISLRVQGGGEDSSAELDEAVLTRILTAMARIEGAAAGRGLVLSPSTSAQVVALRGVLSSNATPADVGPLREELMVAFGEALAEFGEMRRHEGAALAEILTGQLEEVEALVEQAAVAVEARKDEQAERLRAQLARVLDPAHGFDEARLTQELALIAVKSDVTEELDRLTAHIGAARELLAAEGAVGRRLDFLMQEFNREANTLCSKSGSAALTQIGLTLKTVIDQMREQVQNVE
ncbi:YicC family protein [Alloyangia pacifica]|uniref:YicC family protein n=2 Tax=Alloyangia pacifica TaxID=311180 RepID=A0A2U8HC87_9RHOB|nr:YicC family protein [Alloyangia pacifica]